MARRRFCVPMMALCLLVSACGGEKAEKDLRTAYQEMTGCRMEASVSCAQETLLWEGTLSCTYFPDGETTVEVLAPEEIAGVKAVMRNSDWYLEYEDACLNAGSVGSERISPATCLPRLMSALREGWLLEENEETWRGVLCRRLALEQYGETADIVATVWLRLDDATPLRGELAMDGENILTAEFTSFAFCDILTNDAGN